MLGALSTLPEAEDGAEDESPRPGDPPPPRLGDEGDGERREDRHAQQEPRGGGRRGDVGVDPQEPRRIGRGEHEEPNFEELERVEDR